MMRPWIAVFCVIATPAFADYEKIAERQAFLDALDGRALNIGLFNLSINVLDSGQITGTAVGWNLTGTWDWKDGLFCREIDWSGMQIEYNCQLVETNGEKLRFTSDGGTGASADFRLK